MRAEQDREPESRHWCHATAVLVGEAGLLLRGPSGSGKSTLADRLMWAATRQGLFSALVGDDRVALRVRSGRLLASGHPEIAGQIEHRGFGILDRPYVREAVIRGVVDLGAEPERLPAPSALETRILGITMPRRSGTLATLECASLIEWAVRRR